MTRVVARVVPGALKPGDLIAENGQSLLVVSEPLAVARGCGPWDEIRLMVGVRVHDVSAAVSSFRVWPPDVRLDVIEQTA